VIKSFADKETERVWQQQYSKKLPRQIQARALRKLIMIARSRSLYDLRLPPSNELEALKGDRKGQHSVRINRQWRICFKWRGDDASQVSIVDYH
jgi:proteic killer suppression protein